MKTTNDKNSTDNEPVQLDFFFWLGADGELNSVSERDFNEKQEKWDGLRPQGS